MNPFEQYVGGFEELLGSGRFLSASTATAPVLPELSATAPVCLVVSPHPDDEAISGGLPLRLRCQSGWRIVNTAVTFGSNEARRAQRWLELTRCCEFLGFELVSASGESLRGLERVLPQTVAADAAHWAHCVARIAAQVLRYRPQLIVCPHANDGHPAHVGTHLLVMDALRSLGPELRVHLALSEYWNTQSAPGLMVELHRQHVGTLVAALSLHAGEVARNPYHLTLPAWFIDGVRRGAERVRAPGSEAPAFCFAALYGWQRWESGKAVPMPARVIPVSQLPGELFG